MHYNPTCTRLTIYVYNESEWASTSLWLCWILDLIKVLSDCISHWLYLTLQITRCLYQCIQSSALSVLLHRNDHLIHVFGGNCRDHLHKNIIQHITKYLKILYNDHNWKMYISYISLSLTFYYSWQKPQSQLAVHDDRACATGFSSHGSRGWS